MFAASSASAIEEGRFPACTVLAWRYRVLGLIGHGVGEVYRTHLATVLAWLGVRMVRYSLPV